MLQAVSMNWSLERCARAHLQLPDDGCGPPPCARRSPEVTVQVVTEVQYLQAGQAGSTHRAWKRAVSRFDSGVRGRVAQERNIPKHRSNQAWVSLSHTTRDGSDGVNRGVAHAESHSFPIGIPFRLPLASGFDLDIDRLDRPVGLQTCTKRRSRRRKHDLRGMQDTRLVS